MTSLYSALLDRLQIPITVVTATGVIMYRNRAFDQTFGTEAEGWMRSAATSVAGERGWLYWFFGDGEKHSAEVEWNGRIYRIEKVMSEPVDAASVALLIEDVTRQAEAEQAKSDFTSMIVHDLRGPLSGIQATLDFVVQDEDNFGPMHQDLLKEASLESDRMMNLINEILDFSKIQSGKFTVENEPIRLVPLLKRTALSLQAIAARNEVTLISAYGPDLPIVNGSTEKLTQAMINLLSNSLKFTARGGVIALNAQPFPDDNSPDSVAITVTDTGVGISEEELQKLFSRYEQVSSRSFHGESGTGLGLFIVREIIEAHGGTMEVASIEGIGTSMIIRLPVVKEQKAVEEDDTPVTLSLFPSTEYGRRSG
ncbi:MAG: HAMP domain-containing sensor histidine kinase [Acidobacteriota bacterium]